MVIFGVNNGFLVSRRPLFALERKFRQHHKAIIGGTVPYLDQWDIDLNRYNAGFGSCLISFSEWLYPVTGATILIIVLA